MSEELQREFEGVEPSHSPAAVPDEINPTAASAEIVKLADIKRAEYNPRKISEWALEALRKSMMKFGDLSGITVNVRTQRLVGGHQRLKHFDPAWKVIKQMCIKNDVGTVAEGHIETPFGRWSYREVDWDEVTEKAANIAANKHGGVFDAVKVKKLIKDVEGQLDLGLMGLDENEIKSFVDPHSLKDEKDDGQYKMSKERYANAEIKQVVLYFMGEQFNSVLERLAKFSKELGSDNNTDTVLKLMEYYENSKS